VKRSVASLTPDVGRAPAPPREVFERSVVATRATPAIVRPTQGTDLKAGNVAVLQPRLVPPPPHDGSLSPEHLTSQLTPRAEHTMLLPRAGQTDSVIRTPAPREPITPPSKGSEKPEVGGPLRTGVGPPLHPETVKPARIEDIEAQTGRSRVRAPSGASNERLPSPPPPRFDDAWRQPIPHRIEKLPPSASPSFRFSTSRENGAVKLPHSPVERAFPGVPAMQLHDFGNHTDHRR